MLAHTLQLLRRFELIDGRQLAELNRCAAEITKYTGRGKAERGCARQNQCRSGGSPSAQSRWPVLSYTAASAARAGRLLAHCVVRVKASNSHFKSCSLLLFHAAALLSNCDALRQQCVWVACGPGGDQRSAALRCAAMVAKVGGVFGTWT
jgi:hypothetical protein